MPSLSPITTSLSLLWTRATVFILTSLLIGFKTFMPNICLLKEVSWSCVVCFILLNTKHWANYFKIFLWFSEWKLLNWMPLICILSKAIYIAVDWPQYKALACSKLCLLQHIKSAMILNWYKRETKSDSI